MFFYYISNYLSNILKLYAENIKEKILKFWHNYIEKFFDS